MRKILFIAICATFVLGTMSCKKEFDRERAEEIVQNYQTKLNGQSTSEKKEALDLLTIMYNDIADKLETIVENTKKSGDDTELAKFIYEIGNGKDYSIMYELENVSYNITSDREDNNKAIERVLKALEMAADYIPEEECVEDNMFVNNYSDEDAFKGVVKHFVGIYACHAK